MRERWVTGIDGPVLFGAYCSRCRCESMPLEPALICGFCDRRLLSRERFERLLVERLDDALLERARGVW